MAVSKSLRDHRHHLYSLGLLTWECKEHGSLTQDNIYLNPSGLVQCLFCKIMHTKRWATKNYAEKVSLGVKELSDVYIYTLLKQQRFYFNGGFPIELIKLKRAQIMLKRELKEIKKDAQDGYDRDDQHGTTKRVRLWLK